MNKLEVEAEMNKFREWVRKESKERGLNFIEYKPVAIGYLEFGEEYQKGIVSQLFISKLRQIWDNGSKCMSLGYHECEFCIDEGNWENRYKGSSEKVIIDKKNKIEYKFPEMIFHYIEKHNFQPQEDFILFVLRLQENGI